MIFIAFVLVYALEAMWLHRTIRRQKPGLGAPFWAMVGMALTPTILWAIAPYVHLDPTLTMLVGWLALLNWAAVGGVLIWLGLATSSLLA